MVPLQDVLVWPDEQLQIGPDPTNRVGASRAATNVFFNASAHFLRCRLAEVGCHVPFGGTWIVGPRRQCSRDTLQIAELQLTGCTARQMPGLILSD
jgi:hypothetical protein